MPKVTDGAYVITVDEYNSMVAYWIALYVNGDNTTYFDSFEVEYIPKEIYKFISNENIITNIFRILANDSVMWGYYWFYTKR